MLLTAEGVLYFLLLVYLGYAGFGCALFFPLPLSGSRLDRVAGKWPEKVAFTFCYGGSSGVSGLAGCYICGTTL